jgi:hypothetical protein
MSLYEKFYNIDFGFLDPYYEKEIRPYQNSYSTQYIGTVLRKGIAGLENGINLFSFSSEDPINAFDPLGLAKYQVYWHMWGISVAVLGHVRISGVVIAKEKKCEGRCKGMYEAAIFKGKFYGFSVGSPIGGTFNNAAEFEDEWGDYHNVERIEGPACIHSGTVAVNRFGVSVGYYQFGELKSSASISDVDQGYDLSLDRVVGRTYVVELICVLDWEPSRWQPWR